MAKYIVCLYMQAKMYMQAKKLYFIISCISKQIVLFKQFENENLHTFKLVLSMF